CLMAGPPPPEWQPRFVIPHYLPLLAALFASAAALPALADPSPALDRVSIGRRLPCRAALQGRRRYALRPHRNARTHQQQRDHSAHPRRSAVPGYAGHFLRLLPLRPFLRAGLGLGAAYYRADLS